MSIYDDCVRLGPGSSRTLLHKWKVIKLCFESIEPLLSTIITWRKLEEKSYCNWHNSCSLIKWQVGLFIPKEYGIYPKRLSLPLCFLPLSPLSNYLLFLDLVAVAFGGVLECSFLIPRSPAYFPKVSLRNRSLPQIYDDVFRVSRSMGHPFIWSSFEVESVPWNTLFSYPQIWIQAAFLSVCHCPPPLASRTWGCCI